MITLESAAKTLLSKDKILILTHRSPDGDTIGSGYALAMALRKLGKSVKVDCTDPFLRSIHILLINSKTRI